MNTGKTTCCHSETDSRHRLEVHISRGYQKLGSWDGDGFSAGVTGELPGLETFIDRSMDGRRSPTEKRIDACNRELPDLSVQQTLPECAHRYRHTT